MEMEKYTPNCARFFMRKKYTTFSTDRIVALRSVSKIFPESYDFAANNDMDINPVTPQWEILNNNNNNPSLICFSFKLLFALTAKEFCSSIIFFSS
jgi:hypothetical protein